MSQMARPLSGAAGAANAASTRHGGCFRRIGPLDASRWVGGCIPGEHLISTLV